jgi:hypothetical protein
VPVHFGTACPPVLAPDAPVADDPPELPEEPDAPAELPELAEVPEWWVVPCADLGVFRVLRAGPPLALLITCRGRYARELTDAELSSAAAPATWPGAVT